MKTRIVNIADVKKTAEEREAEEPLNQLAPGKAIEITLTGNDTPKRVARLYRYAAKRLRKFVRIETIEKGAKLLVYFKGRHDD